MRRAAGTRSGRQDRAATIPAAISRRAMMKTVGLGAAALAAPALVAGCSSAGGRTGIKFEETGQEPD